MRIVTAASLMMALAACAGSDPETGDDTESDDLAAKGTFKNPLLRNSDGSYDECPDPNVTKFGDHYFMVCTSPHIGHAATAFPIRWSSDLVHWHFIGHVFNQQHHPSWAKAPSHGTYWAPEIYRLKNHWVVYFAASDERRNGSMAIGVATAEKISGPWHATDVPLVEQEDNKSGRIDPTIVRDPSDGRLYLYYVYQPRWVRVARLSENGLHVEPGTDHQLELSTGEQFAVTEPWEGTTVEGVEAQYHEGFFYLLYSGNSTWNGTYAVGVARSTSPTGPFEKLGPPILKSSQHLLGPGHSSHVTHGPNGHDYLLFHVQRPGHLGHSAQRLLAIDRVTWGADGWPRVPGGKPTEGPQPVP